MFLHVELLGEVSYTEAMEHQLYLVEQKKMNPDLPETVLLLEHSRVYTAGKKMVGFPHKTIQDIPVLRTQRSGGMTYHGPGQLLAYVIVALKKNNKTLKSLQWDLEEIAILFLKKYGLEGRRTPLHAGVWVEGKLLVMVGLGITAGISFHGMALNLNVDLAPFFSISPCGLDPALISSVKALLQKEVDMEEARSYLAQAFQLYWSS